MRQQASFAAQVLTFCQGRPRRSGQIVKRIFGCRHRRRVLAFAADAPSPRTEPLESALVRDPSNPPGSPRLRLHHVWLVLPLATALLLSWHSLSDRDVWFHARAGRDLLAEGRLTRVNRYSFTAPDHPWLNHEWLFQSAVAVTAPDLPPEGDDPLLGWSALRLLLVLGLVLVLMLGDGGLAPGVPPGRIMLTAAATLAALGLIWTRLTLRPELVSYALLAVLVRAAGRTLAATGVPGRRRDWLDPRRAPGQATLATLLWAQVHGFAGLAPAVWLLAFAAALVEGRGRQAIPLARRALGGLALACLALALTPNGPAGLLYPLRALGQFRADQPRLGGMIAELVPLLDTRDALGTTLLVFKVSLAWCGLWIVAQWGRIPLLRVLVLALAAAAALAAQRALGLYAVAFVLLHTGARWPLRGVGRLRLPPRWHRAGLPACGLLLVAVCALWWPAIHSDRFYLGEGVARRWGAGLTPAHVPLGALAELERNGVPTLLTNIDAAGAALALGRAAVFIDGRTEAYPPALWRDYAALRGGGDAADAVLSRWQPGSVLLAYGSGAFTGPDVPTAGRTGLAPGRHRRRRRVVPARGRAAGGRPAAGRRSAAGGSRGPGPVHRPGRRPLPGRGPHPGPGGRPRGGGRRPGPGRRPAPGPPAGAAQSRQRPPGGREPPGRPGRLHRRVCGQRPAGRVGPQRRGLRPAPGAGRRGRPLVRPCGGGRPAAVRGLGEPGGGQGTGGRPGRGAPGAGAGRRAAARRPAPARAAARVVIRVSG